MLRVSICGLILVGVFIQVAGANGVLRDPLGARVGGRGGANVAFADSGMILHDNPAGMVNLPSQQFMELGVDVIFTDILYSDPDNARVKHDSDPIPLGNLSIVRQSDDGQLAFGLGLFSPGGFSSDYMMNGPFPYVGPQKYKSFSSLTRILPGAAYAVNDWFSIGGTLGVAVSHTELEGPHFLQYGPTAGIPTRIDTQATGAALSWSLGAQFDLSERTTIGVAYQSQNQFHLDGNTRVEIPLLGASRFDTTLDMTWPRTATLGIKHRASPCHLLGVDIGWYNWSDSFDQVGLHLSNPENPAFALAVGNQVTEQLPLIWRDSLSVRLGMEREFGCQRVFRIGYSYMENPVPAETLTPYIPTILQHSVGAGYGWSTHGYEIDLAYQFFFSPTIDVEQSEIIGGDFDNSTVRTQVHVAYLGLIKRF